MDVTETLAQNETCSKNTQQPLAQKSVAQTLAQSIAQG
jgi:hypothetical protein